MPPARVIPRSIVLGLVVAATGLLWASGALAFPPAGSDTITVSGRVSITSRLGQETISLTGSVTVSRGNPYMQGGAEVVDTEIVAMSLTGMSLTGPVTVVESPTRASTGQLQSLQPLISYPASSFFDVFIGATIPASGPGGQTATLHNDTALHVVATNNVYRWPPASATYQMQAGAAATPTPGATPIGGAPACSAGMSLLPQLPEYICITSASFTITSPVGGSTELSGIELPAEETGPVAPGAWGPSAGTITAIVGGVMATIVFGAAIFAYHRARW